MVMTGRRESAPECASAQAIDPSALVGLVPNCAVSVLLAQLYVQGAISFGSLFAGLTAGAGVGLAVLWRVNPSWKQNLFMTGLLWAVGAATGMLLQLLPL